MSFASDLYVHSATVPLSRVRVNAIVHREGKQWGAR